jgi:hypothetical protein
MDWTNALKLLKEGKKIRLPNWSPESFIQKVEYGKLVCHTGKSAYFMDSHFDRTDWEEYKESIAEDVESTFNRLFNNMFDSKRTERVFILVEFEDGSCYKFDRGVGL